MVAPVVIVGASLGGLRTAEWLRRFGYLGPIQVFGDEPHLPYNRPPLSKEVLASGISHEAVAFPLKESIEDVIWKLDVIPENVKGMHVLRNLDDALALRSDLRPGAKVVILGSGSS